MKREKNHKVLNFSEKVKENESIIDLSGFCWVFSIIKSAFRNIYICWKPRALVHRENEKSKGQDLINHQGAVTLTTRRIGKLQSTRTKQHQSPNDGK